ncbi:hypothetical protein LVJ94_09500 [Pendulispora rubella]|uniref:Uncharacterized protein n=1 Tax=Pendulispora rubella TaxID=2741070 RepID=A0ABZ2LC23_9BACT
MREQAILLSVATLLTVSVPAYAQAPSPSPEPAPAPAAEPEPAPAEAYPTPAPPPPEPPKEAPKEEKQLLRFYAWVKPTVTVSSAAVESFSQPNASAISAAGNPALASVPDDARATFQVAQSRFGVWVNEKEPVRGQLEFDLVDFTKASPTVASVPRIRIAKGEWAPSNEVLLVAGQDWDLHAPIAPHGYNLVGAAYLAGNTGFMRQQLKVLYTLPNLELGAAIGLQGNNNTNRDASIELSRMPTFAVRAAYLAGDVGRVGVSGIVSQLRFGPGTNNDHYVTAGGGALYFDLTPVKPFNVRAEGYVGRNLANLSLLALGQRVGEDDIDEIGGFLSAKYKVSDSHAIYAHGGTAQTLKPSKVSPSYSYPAAAAGATPGPAALSGTGPGLKYNITVRVGYEIRISKFAAVYLEGSYYRSKFALVAADDGRFDSLRQAFVGDLGMMFTL